MQTIDQLNETIRAHKRNHKLNDTERAVLDVLAQYSCKDVGKSWLAKSTIAQLVGKSRRTVIRVCNRLESLGIIRQYERKRESGDRRQTSNLIVIVPAKLDDVTPACHTEETPPRNLNNNYIHNTYANAPQPTTHYGKFRQLIAATLGNVDKQLIYRLYGVYKGQSTPLLRTEYNDKATVEAIGLQALKTAIFSTKRKQIRNLAGYYNGVLDRMFDKILLAELRGTVFNG